MPELPSVGARQQTEVDHRERREKAVENARVEDLNPETEGRARWIRTHELFVVRRMVESSNAEGDGNGEDEPEDNRSDDEAQRHGSRAESPAIDISRAENEPIDARHGRECRGHDGENEDEITLHLAIGHGGDRPIVLKTVLKNVRQGTEVQMNEVTDRGDEEVQRTWAAVVRALDEREDIHQRTEETRDVEKNAHVFGALFGEMSVFHRQGVVCAVAHPAVPRIVSLTTRSGWILRASMS